MKKSIIVFLAIVVCLSLCACDSTSTTQGRTTIQETNSPTTEQTATLAEQMTVTDYTCVVADSFCYYVMFMKNDSEECVSVEANIVAKDETGANISAYSESVYAVAPGQTSCIWTTFDEWDTIKSFEYTLAVDKESIERSIYNDISFDYNTTENKVIATATNNGNETATFIWFDVVFLKNGEMVGFGEISLMDNDCELLPGATITNEAECYSENGFDDVVIAVNGRK